MRSKRLLLLFASIVVVSCSDVESTDPSSETQEESYDISPEDINYSKSESPSVQSPDAGQSSEESDLIDLDEPNLASSSHENPR